MISPANKSQNPPFENPENIMAVGAAAMAINASRHPNAVTTSGRIRVAKSASANAEIALIRTNTSASCVVSMTAVKRAAKPKTIQLDIVILGITIL